MELIINNPRVRFAPSPTGLVHLGSIRTFLYNYIIAKKYNGTLILRVEDTDTERFVPGALEDMLVILKQFGLAHDEGPFLNAQGAIEQRGDFAPYIQSQRLAIYKESAEKLVDQGQAYICFCTEERLKKLRENQIAAKLAPGYDKLCRNIPVQETKKRREAGERCVIRLKVPEGKTSYSDAVHGEITVDNSSIDDQVLIKANGYPTYHLAVVVDDYAMRITHVARGEEWMPSTPKHVLLYKSFNWEMPVFIHFPLMLDAQRRKLSKRAMDVSVSNYLSKGYLPKALINFCALLGWHPGDDREIYEIEDLIKAFDISRLQKSGAIFNLEKLDWVNSQHIRKASLENLFAWIADFMHLKKDANEYSTSDGFTASVEQWSKAVRAIQDRLVTLAEAKSMLDFFTQDLLQYEALLLIPKKSDAVVTLDSLNWVFDQLQNLTEDNFYAEMLRESFMKKIEHAGRNRGEVLWPFRVALTGKAQSPDVFDVASALGKEKVLKRLQFACKIIKK